MSYRKILTYNELAVKQREILSLNNFFAKFVDTPIVVTDEYANIIYANKATEQVTGYSFNEMVGKTPGDLWGGYEDDKYYEKLWQTIELTRKYFKGIITNKKKDLSPVRQQLNIICVHNDQENIIFYLAIEPVVTNPNDIEVDLPPQLNLFLQWSMNRKLTLADLRNEIDKYQKTTL